MQRQIEKSSQVRSASIIKPRITNQFISSHYGHLTPLIIRKNYIERRAKKRDRSCSGLIEVCSWLMRGCVPVVTHHHHTSFNEQTQTCQRFSNEINSQVWRGAKPKTSRKCEKQHRWDSWGRGKQAQWWENKETGNKTQGNADQKLHTGSNQKTTAQHQNRRNKTVILTDQLPPQLAALSLSPLYINLQQLITSWWFLTCRRRCEKSRFPPQNTCWFWLVAWWVCEAAVGGRELTKTLARCSLLTLVL